MSNTLDSIAPHVDAFRASIVGYEEEWPDVVDALDALPTMGRRGTARAYFEAHHGRAVSTVQVRRNGRAWAPGVRTVDASRATAVRLDGSVREYAGLHVIATDGETLIAHDTSGFDTMIIYRATH